MYYKVIHEMIVKDGNWKIGVARSSEPIKDGEIILSNNRASIHCSIHGATLTIDFKKSSDYSDIQIHSIFPKGDVYLFEFETRGIQQVVFEPNVATTGIPLISVPEHPAFYTCIEWHVTLPTLTNTT